MSGQRPLDLGGRLRGPWHLGLTTMMVLVAVTVALTEVLLVVQAWQFAGNEVALYEPQDGQGIPRLTLMAQVLTYMPFGMEAPGVLAGAVAAAVAFALAAHRQGVDSASGWRRVSWAATFVAGVVGLLTVLVHLFVQVSVLISMDDSIEAVFGPTETLSGLGRVLAAGADVLLWAGALLVGLMWRADAWSPGSQEDLAPADDELDLEEVEDLTDPSEEVAPSPAVPTSAYARPAVPDPPTGPRLEADGSSDSGYDEFRFRR